MAQPVNTGLGTAPHDVGHGPKIFPPLDATTFAPQLIWLAITFGALYYLMSRIALPRIGDVIDERRDRIQRDLDQAERIKVETEAALKAYEQSLAEARSRAQDIAKETRDRLTGEVDRERQRVDAEIAAKIADTERRIEETKVRSLASVNDIAGETAGAIVARLIGKDASPAEIKAALAPAAGE